MGSPYIYDLVAGDNPPRSASQDSEEESIVALQIGASHPQLHSICQLETPAALQGGPTTRGPTSRNSLESRTARKFLLKTMGPFWLWIYGTAPNIWGVPRWDPSFGNYPAEGWA